MIISVKLLSTLDQCKLDSLTTISPVAIDTEEVCAEKSKLVSQQYQEEIENLRDQIRELQANLRREKAGNILGHTGASTKLSPGCMSELHYSEKLQHTDILKAQNYPSERHAPTFTHFDHWYHYSLSAGLSGKVIEKVNGAQRVSFIKVTDFWISFVWLLCLYGVTYFDICVDGLGHISSHENQFSQSFFFTILNHF